MRVWRAKDESPPLAAVHNCWMFGVEHRFVARQPHGLMYFAQHRIGCRIPQKQGIQTTAANHPVRLRTKARDYFPSCARVARPAISPCQRVVPLRTNSGAEILLSGPPRL